MRSRRENRQGECLRGQEMSELQQQGSLIKEMSIMVSK